MAKLIAANGYEHRSPATQLANGAVQVEEPDPVATSRRKRSRVASIRSATVSLVIPVRNEARKIAGVLEQIAGLRKCGALRTAFSAKTGDIIAAMA
jgi:hypothetical protein